MNNYQLYRTNVLLSGQMKWDLILDYDNEGLVVSDFHLTPISNVTPYTYISDEYLLNNTHQDNVKAYYNKTKSYFYNECLESGFTHNWPLICNEGDVLNTYSNTYDMGCRRSKHYNLYKKQFEFLCPLWLEKVDNDIKFIITIKPINSDNILATKTLTINVLNDNAKLPTYHTKFVKYLKNYLDDAGITNGNDDVLNVSFSKNNTYMHGLDVSNGLFQTRYLYDFVDNITHRERPLMETDYMITHSFCDKKMICKQLYNFNLCFNLDDIFSSSLIGINSFYGEKICVHVEVKIGDSTLEKRDFYTDYKHINKIVFGEKPETNETHNVLDYLQDDKYIEFINKNKFCQSTCHWSLADNNDYIFNVYDGFSGIYYDGENYYENSHQYGEAPNILLQNYSKQQNTNGWINVKYDVSFANLIKYLVNPKLYKLHGTDMNANINFIKNIKYKYIPPFVDEKNDKKYVLGICLKDIAIKEFEKNIIVDNTDKTNPIYKISLNSIINGITSTNDTTIQIFKIGNEAYLIDKDGLILIITNDKNVLSFRNFSNAITSYNTGANSDKNQTIVLLKMLFKNVIVPEFIVFNKSLQYTNTLSPDTTNSEEITYFKDDNPDTAYNYVIRYDGKIKPTFTTTASTLYIKDYVSNNSESENGSKLQNSNYTKYDNNKFEPLYPSIDYCAIKYVDNWDYNNVPTCKVTEHINAVNLIDTKYEYTWFNKNACYVLYDNLTFSYIKDKNININDIIKNNIQNTYNIFDDNNLLNYIFNLYEIYECTNNNTSDDNTYTVSLKLK